jgi:hypothetical protein
MKSLFIVAALAASAAFAGTDSAFTAPIRTVEAPKIGEHRDSLRVLDSLKFREVFEGQCAKDSAAWSAKIPDSVKAKVEARRADWAAKRDSMKAKAPRLVKADIDSLKAAWEAKRAEEIAKLPVDVQEKIKARLAAVEAKHAAIEAKIEARRAEIKAKIEAKKETVEAPITTP